MTKNPRPSGADLPDDTRRLMAEFIEPVYDISVAPAHDSKRWAHVTVTWQEFVDALPSYACWLGGTLSGKERTRAALEHRTMWSLDEDDATDLEARLGPLVGTAFVMHPTKSSTPDAPRARLAGPLSRPATEGEYWLISHALMDALQWRKDRTGAQAERLMYGPEDREVQAYDGHPLDADEWIRRAKETGVPEREPEATGEGAAFDPDEPITDEHHAKARNVLAKAARQVEAIANETTGEMYAGRNEALIKNLALPMRFVAAGVLDAADVETVMRSAVEKADGDHPFDEREFQTVLSHAETYAEPLLPIITAAVPVTTPGGSGGPAMPPLAVRLRQAVESRYDVFAAGGDGRIFAQPKGGGRAELLTGPFVIRASQGLGMQAGSLSAAATEAAKVLSALAEAAPPRTLSMRVHHRPDRIVVDLAQPGDSRCVVVTADGWTVADAPPADVTFQNSGLPLPEPERGGSLDELRRVLRWREDDPSWLLVKGWLPCTLLAEVPRPVIGFFGEQGSSKSTTGRFLADLIDPKPNGTLGGGFARTRNDDETKAFGSYLAAWDNVSYVSDESADLLSRMVTGDVIERRKLYSDADVVRIAYRRTGILTGIVLPRGIKPDTLDRLILISLRPLAERLSETALADEWARVRGRVFAGMLDAAVRILGGRGQNPEGLRMADYAEALWAMDPALYWAYAVNVSHARADLAEEDPFVGVVVRWLRDVNGGAWTGTPSDALEAAGRYRDLETGWWPPNARSFSEMLLKVAPLLRSVGVTVTDSRSNGKRLKTFRVAPPDASDLL